MSGIIRVSTLSFESAKPESCNRIDRLQNYRTGTVLFPSPLKADVGKGKETLRIQSVHLQCDTDRNRTFTETTPIKII